MISNALVVSIVCAVSALTVGYGLGELWFPAAAVLALGALWIVGQRARWTWIGWPMPVLFAVAAAIGTWLDLSPILLLVGLITAVSAWELDGFARRLESVDAVEQEQELQRRHLRRLLAADGVGLLGALLALQLKVKLGLGLALVLGVVALVGLSRAIGFLGRESDS